MAADARRRKKGKGGSRKSGEKPFWYRTLRRMFVWGAALGLLAAIALGGVIYMTARELPGFTDLKTSQHGQMIVVRARDGTEIVSRDPAGDEGRDGLDRGPALSLTYRG